MLLFSFLNTQYHYLSFIDKLTLLLSAMVQIALVGYIDVTYSVSPIYLISMCILITIGTLITIFALNHRIISQWQIFNLNQNIPLLTQECALNHFIDPHYSFAKQIILNALTSSYYGYREEVEEYHAKLIDTYIPIEDINISAKYNVNNAIRTVLKQVVKNEIDFHALLLQIEKQDVGSVTEKLKKSDGVRAVLKHNFYTYMKLQDQLKELVEVSLKHHQIQSVFDKSSLTQLKVEARATLSQSQYQKLVNYLTFIQKNQMSF